MAAAASGNMASCAGAQSCIWTILRVVEWEWECEAADQSWDPEACDAYTEGCVGAEPKGAMVEFVASVPKQPTSNVDATRSLPGTIPVASARPGWCRSGFPGPFLVVARALPPPWDVRWRGSVGSGNSPEFLLQKPGRSGTGSTGGDGLQLHRMDRRRGEGGRWGPASARLASARLALRLGLGLAEWERRMGVRRRRVRIRGRVSPTTKNKVTLGASGMGTGLEMRMALAVEIKKKREGQDQFATTKGIKHCSGRVREACAASPNLLAAGLSGLGGTGHRVWPGQPGNILGVPACQDCCRPEKYGGAQAKPHPRIGFAPFSPIPIPALHLGQSGLLLFSPDPNNLDLHAKFHTPSAASDSRHSNCVPSSF